MTITRWMRGALRINAHNAIDPEAQIGPLAKAGYRRVEILVNSLPDHVPPVPRSWVDRVKKAGIEEVFIVVWADSFENPVECADFAIAEKYRLNANGIIVNAEDGVEAWDQEEAGAWSWAFLARLRATVPRIPLALDTYIGCGGLALNKWQRAGARLICQTHHEAATFEWGVEGYVAWAKKYGWTEKSKIKPEFGVYRSSTDNQRPDRAAQIESARRAGTVGYVAYAAEMALDENVLVPLLNEAMAAGVCR